MKLATKGNKKPTTKPSTSPTQPKTKKKKPRLDKGKAATSTTTTKSSKSNKPINNTKHPGNKKGASPVKSKKPITVVAKKAKAVASKKNIAVEPATLAPEKKHRRISPNRRHKNKQRVINEPPEYDFLKKDFEVTPEQKAEITKVFTRNGKIKKILEIYLKEMGLEFNISNDKLLKMLIESCADYKVPFLIKYFDAIFRKEIVSPVHGHGLYPRHIPTGFKFFLFTDNLGNNFMRGMNIKLEQSFGKKKFKIEGKGLAFVKQFVSSGLYNFLRENYTFNPTAYFELKDTDGSTFAEYRIKIAPNDEMEGDKNPSPEFNKGNLYRKVDLTAHQAPKISPEISTETDEDDLDDEMYDEDEEDSPSEEFEASEEDEYDDETELKIKLEQETQKLLDDKVKAIKELKDLGLNMQEIKKYLDIK